MKISLDRLRKSPHTREAAGLVLLVLGVVTLGALVSYSAGDASWFNQRSSGGPRSNWFGWFGATLAETLLQGLGTVAFLVPLALCALGWHGLRRSAPPASPAHIVGFGVVGVSLCALLQLLFVDIAYGGEVLPAGGYLGRATAGALRALFNTPGALILSATTLAAALILTTRVSFVHTAGVLAGYGSRGWRRFAEEVPLRVEQFRQRRAERAAPRVQRPVPPPLEPHDVDRPAAPRSILPPPEPEPEDTPAEPAAPPFVAQPSRKKRKIKPSAPKQASLPMEPGARGYTLPTLDLLNEPEPQTIESEQELLERARLITDKLREFSVNGAVVAIHPGPVVTTFEFKPEAGVKYSKITGMTDDLSLALKAESVRIDRMPGRATVGIEVPNRRQETIFPRDLFASTAFRESRSKLTLALGKDINGDVSTAELERMPHLLIAGATGSGKSVGLNAMIASILYKASPDEVRFIMIDTKMIELGVYKEIPHLLIPVVTEAKHAATSLQWAVREMERRYRQLAAVGVRNISQFNEMLEREPGRTMDDPKTGEPVELKQLPFIVIVIDELADLMMISSSDVEEAIMRLAQMARAVGIHLIIATQRPSVDVITGTIKANFPSRIAFRVSQRVDSRTIIDQQGAEHLLGRGDMLFLSSGSLRLKRVHGALLTEAEINRVTAFIRKIAEPVYDESVLEEGGAAEVDGLPGGGERDEMYARAVRTVIQEGKCSITLIQRRLQLGYARAARIVDMMEREGVVSVGEGSKPREILVGADYVETIEAS